MITKLTTIVNSISLCLNYIIFAFHLCERFINLSMIFIWSLILLSNNYWSILNQHHTKKNYLWIARVFGLSWNTKQRIWNENMVCFCCTKYFLIFIKFLYLQIWQNELLGMKEKIFAINLRKWPYFSQTFSYPWKEFKFVFVWCHFYGMDWQGKNQAL